MNRTAWTIALVIACLLVGAAATLWLGTTVLRLEQEQRAYQDRATLEENVRLALWRMDSALGPFIAAESMRPYNLYTAFYQAPEAIDPSSNGIFTNPVLIPSPLLTYTSPYVKLHFQLDESGGLTSPQVPEEAQRPLADSNYLTPGALSEAMERLESLKPIVEFDDLVARLQKPLDMNTHADINLAKPPRTFDIQASNNISELFSRIDQATTQQGAPSFKITNKNGSKVSGDIDAAYENAGFGGIPDFSANATTTWNEDPVVPLWLGEELVLARTVRANTLVRVQGSWLDWPAVQSWLLGLCDDLLPNATLVRTADGHINEPDFPGRQLASLPVRLVAGELPPAVYFPSPLRPYLALAVGGIVTATLAVILLLWGTLVLSERRARFVAAVTHELRTPLTTFQLYTEMLARGMVSDPEKRQAYVETLHAESGRLAYLVENVLAYARLERRSHTGQRETLPLYPIIERMRDRLKQRAEEANMTVLIEKDGTAATVVLDPAILEQILYNLVDNACKYAASATDRRIHLRIVGTSSHAYLRVVDHGPGIAPADARRIFRPFTKSVHEAARSAPGVGLGLGLCKRLARTIGAQLYLEHIGDGTCFTLKFPRAQ